MKWQTLPLDALKAPVRYAFVGGPFGSNLTTRDYVEEGVPVIRGNNLPPNTSFAEDEFAFVREKKADDLPSNTAFPGDLVFTQRGTLGQVGLIPRESRFPRYIISQSQMKLTVDQRIADPRFVYYFFRLPATVQRVVNHALSSGVPHINLGILKEFKITIPELACQQRIADILTAYDDHMDNNRRRIALLEESARQLYREWFIRLRFPGYEHTHIAHGFPDRWERKTLGDLCYEVRESVNPKLLEPNIPYIGLEHIPRRSISLSEWGTAQQVTSSKHRFREGEVLFGKIRPYFHKVGVAFVDGIASSDAIIIRPLAPKLRGFVLLTVSSDPFVAVTAQTMREGSKMPRADWKQMQAYSTPLPPDGLLSSFEATIQPIVEQLRSLSFAIQKLRAARDLLLPRLMSGEIVV